MTNKQEHPIVSELAPFDLRRNDRPSLCAQDTSLAARLQWRAEHSADALAYRFLEDGEAESESLTYRQLHRRACAVARELLTRGAQGKTVLLAHPQGLEFLVHFWGCLYAGAIAVPVYAPTRRNREALAAIAADCQPVVVLTPGQGSAVQRGQYAALRRASPALQSVAWVAGVQESDSVEPLPLPRPEDVAFVQYTSGSTSAPRGVVIANHRLMANLRALQAAFEQQEGQAIVSWLPLFHDMGLVGQALLGVFCGSPVTLMPAVRFVEKPVRWLRAIARYRARLSGAPNFAYELCCERISPEQCRDLNLASWQLAFNGAEPVVGETLARFGEQFADCGFSRAAFYPCYGMAEACVFLTGGRFGSGPVVRSFDRALLQGGQAKLAEASSTADALVACGRPWGEERLRIAAPDTTRWCREAEVGEIWVRGPSVAEQYYGAGVSPALPKGQLADSPHRWLRTGDLGFFFEGELYVTGRLKDMLIVQGRNHYPQDIERCLTSRHAELAPGGCVAFGWREASGESLVVVAECTRSAVSLDLEAVVERIRQTLSKQIELTARSVVLVRPGAVPRTTSGKLQRGRCRQLWLDGGLAVAYEHTSPGPGPEPGQLPVGVEPSQAVALPASIEGPAARQGALCPATEVLARMVAGATVAQRTALLDTYVQAQLQQVLGLTEPVDLRRSGTGLGLNSLQLAELTQQLSAVLGRDVALSDLLGDRPLGQLLQQWSESVEPSQSQGVRAADLRETTSEQDAPISFCLSAGQRALYAVHERQRHDSSNNIHLALQLPSGGKLLGQCSAVPGSKLGLVEGLQRTFEALQARHPVLRTTYQLGDEQALQTIHLPDAGRFVQFEVFEGLDRAAADEVLARLVQTPFDLNEGPCMRVALVEGEGVASGCCEHRLVWVVHHISLDFWSLEVLVADFKRVYSAVAAGEAPPATRASLGMPQLVEAQQRALQRREHELWRYWRQQLAGPLPALELAKDHPRRTNAFEGASVPLRLSSQLHEQLRALSRDQNTTLFSTLLCAFSVVLRSFTGQRDLVIGTPTSGRPSSQFAHLVGYCVNPVPLRIRAPRSLRFEELLSRVHRTVVEALENADMPFSRLVERLNPDRGADLWPLYQVAFTLQTAREDSEQELSPLALGEGHGQSNWGGLQVAGAKLEQRVENFDLKLVFAEGESGLVGSFQFNRALFEPGTLTRVARMLETVLQQVVDDPRVREAQLQIPDPLECAERLRPPHPGSVPRGGALEQRSLPEQLLSRVKAAPESLAVQGRLRGLTYRQLWNEACQLARRLQALGLQGEQKVVVLLPRGPEQVTAALGVLLGGGCYLPLDPELPEARLQQLVHDSRARWLVGQPADAERFAGVCGLSIGWEDSTLHRDGLPAPVAPRPPGALHSARLAYCIYTSGTTGQPKGVEVSHGALGHLVRWHQAQYEVSPSDRASLYASVGFDASVWETWPYLLSGASLHVVPEAARVDPGHYVQWVRDERLTLAFLPTGFGQMVLRQPKLGGAGLRNLLLGGERLDAVPQRFAVEGLAVVNHYGPTECSVVASFGPVEFGTEPPPIGRPLPGAGAAVVQAMGQPAPGGAVGELLLSGPGLARGYAGRPATTAECFVPDPHGPPGSRRYRTGDWVRVNLAGQLDFLGRRDRQTKVRGHRLELGEVEAVLREVPGVSEVAVVVSRSSKGPERLGAFLRLDDAQPNDLGNSAVCSAGPEEQEAAQIADWTELYDSTYGESTPGRDDNTQSAASALAASAATGAVFRDEFVGWQHSHDGSPIERGDMKKWAAATAAAIVRWEPRVLLEIGAGSGIILSRLAPYCQRIVATDVSAPAVRRLRHLAQQLTPVEGQPVGSEDSSGRSTTQGSPGGRRVAGPAGGCQFQLAVGPAHTVFGPESALQTIEALDTIVLNSVVQYFPSGTYLQRVLRDAVARLAPRGGRVFVGDVRDLGSLVDFHVDAQHRTVAPAVAVGQLVHRALRAVRQEAELCVAPQFFAELTETCPGITAVEVQVKAGRYDNELSRYRYDVVLHVGARPAPGGEVATVLWDTVREAGGVASQLSSAPRRSLVVRGVPNGRRVGIAALRGQLFAAVAAGQGAGRLDECLASIPVASDVPDVGELFEVAAQHGYHLVAQPGAEGDFTQLDLVLRPNEQANSRLPWAWVGQPLSELPGRQAQWCNDPIAPRRRAERLQRVRAEAERNLPPYAVPVQWVVVDALPRTPNGKLDGAALGWLDEEPGDMSPGLAAELLAAGPTRSEALSGPASEIEQRLAAIWQRVLGVSRVRPDDNFFQLGGDSILGIRVANAAREDGLAFSARMLFEHQKLSQLAAAVERQLASAPQQPQATVLGPVGAEASSESEAARLSGLRRGLWYQSQAAGAVRGAYVQQLRFDLEGPCEVDSMRQACRWLFERYRVLRAHFPLGAQGEPTTAWQTVQDGFRFEALTVHGDELFQETVKREAAQPLDVLSGPLNRWTLMEREPGEVGSRYTLLWTHHHLLLDGWSAAALAGELFQAYGALCSERLPDLAVRPEDSSVEHFATESQRTVARQFWAELWATARADRGQRLLDPLRQTVPAMANSEQDALSQGTHRREIAYLGDKSSERLKAWARGQRVSLSTLFEATWALLLAAYSGSGSVVFGRVLSGRHGEQPGLERAVGLLVQTVPSALEIPTVGTLGPWLRTVQEQSSRALDHSDLPLAEIRRACGCAGAAELFDSLIAFENYPVEQLIGEQFGQLRLQSASCQDHTHYPITWVIAPGRSVRLQLSYDQRLFGQPWAKALVQQWIELLQWVVQGEDSAEASVGSVWERCVRRQRGGSQTEYEAGVQRRPAPGAHLVTEWRRQVDRSEHRPAVSCGAETLSHGQLWNLVQRRAGQLAAHGVRAGDCVAIALERGLPQVVTALSVLRLGASYVPLDPNHPEARRSVAIRRAGVSLLVCEGSQRVRCASVSVNALEWTLPQSPLPELASLCGAQVAYTIFTSGSTGEPKGVGVTHANVLELMAAADESFGFRATDVWTVFHSPAFDFAVWELWGALLYGGHAVIVPTSVARHPDRLHALLVEREISILSQTPTAFYALQAHCEPRPGALEPLSSLRHVVFGGEALEPSRLAPWVAARGLQTPQLWNLYGITETTVHVTVHRLTEQDVQETTSVIGAPLPHWTVEVAGAHGQALPPTAVGELYVGGAGVSQGYAGQPGLTAARFVPDPHSEAAGARRYRSGDRGVRKPNGDLVHLGRLDSQVQLRGHRIELGEVEVQLCQCPGVGQAAVVLGCDSAGQPRLEAYVAGEGLDRSRLRQLLLQRLPHYMCPAVWWQVEEMPRTVNGKLDRDALQRGAASLLGQAEGEGLAVPGEATPVEGEAIEQTPEDGALDQMRSEGLSHVLSIFRSVLDAPTLREDDNFFEHGGDSISSLRVAAQLGGGSDVSSALVFEHPTARQLSSALHSAGALLGPGESAEQVDPSPTAQVPGRAEPEGCLREGTAFLPIQAWWVDRKLVNPHHFNQALVIDAPEVEVQWLRAALQHLAERHSAFGLRYDVKTGQHRCLPPQARSWPLRVVSPGEQSLRAAAEHAQGALHLSEGPVCRAVLVDNGLGEPNALVLVAHHWVVDAVSWRIVLDELSALCAGGSTPERLEGGGGLALAARLPHRPEDYAVHRYAQAIAERAQRAPQDAEYWLNLEWSQVGKLQLDRPHQSNRVADQRLFVQQFGEAVSRDLLAAVHRGQVTVGDLLLATLVEVLADSGAVRGGSRLRVDVEGHGRQELCDGPHVGDVVGWFTSLYPVLVPLTDGSTAQRVRGLAAARQHAPDQGASFQAQSQFGGCRQRAALCALPAADVSFNYLGQFPESLHGSSPMLGVAEEDLDEAVRGEPVSVVPVGHGRAGCIHAPDNERAHALEVNACVVGGRVVVHWAAAPGWEQATVLGWARSLGVLLLRLASDPTFAWQLESEQLDREELDTIFEQLGGVESL